ncbi:MAG: Clp protease N-terminal domain-containing protein [Caulobacter sp.]
MLDQIKKRFKDMKTIKNLCEQAEHYAIQDDQNEPGAEHFVLSAIDLPDGTAKLAFARAGMDATSFKGAIRSQYNDALRYVGLAPPALGEAPASAETSGQGRALYNAAASGRDLMLALAAARESHNPLLGAHVILIVADMEHGVAARALDVMVTDRAALKRAADDVIREVSAA